MLPPAGEEGPEDRLMCCAARDVALSWTAAVAVEPLKQQQLQLVPLRGSSQGGDVQYHMRVLPSGISLTP